MKKIFFLVMIIACFKSFSQSVAINTNGNAANSSAMLDVSANNKGLLIPRMTTTERQNISSPANGLMVFDITTNTFWYFSATWKEISNSNGGGGGFVLPYNGTASDPNKVFAITNTAGGSGSVALYGKNGNTGSGVNPPVSIGVWGDNSSGVGVVGTSNAGVGTYGLSTQNHGVSGYSMSNMFAGIYGSHGSNGASVLGESVNGGVGIYGKLSGQNGKAGLFENTNSSNNDTVLKIINSGTGVSGYFINPNTDNIGALVAGDNYGKGGGIFMRLWNAQNNSPGIYMYQYGNGAGLYVGSNKSKAAQFYSNGGNNDTTVFIGSDGASTGLQVNLNSGLNTKNAVDVVTNGTGNAAKFRINNSSNSSSAVDVTTNGTGNGIHVSVSNVANLTAAVYGSSSGNKGVEGLAQNYGVLGQSTTLTGGIGVLGQSALNSTDGIGVKGISYSNNTTSGSITGTNNGDGVGVYGSSAGANGNGTGVSGLSSGIMGIGVYGKATGANGIGLKGENSSADYPAIYAVNNNGAGGAIDGESHGDFATGIKGLADPTNGTKGYGVVGQSWGVGDGVRGFGGGSGNGITGYPEDNSSGNGVYGEVSGGTGYAVKGVSSLSTRAAILGLNSAGDGVAGTSNGNGNGIRGTAGPTGATGAGVYGSTNPISTTGRAALFETLASGNTYDAVKVNNAGLGGTLNLNSTNGSNNVTMIRVTKNGTGDFAVFEDGVGDNQIRFSNSGRGYFNGGTQTGGADMAEAFDVTGNIKNYEPGDVLIVSVDQDRTVEKSFSAYSTLVAGVFATKPGVLMSEENIDADISDKVPMGVVGVIPTKVCLEGGEIKRGDLLVTSSIPGVAMKADPNKVKPGQVIGKALENFNASSVGKIKVLVNVK